jgi:hypothetical protein
MKRFMASCNVPPTVAPLQSRRRRSVFTQTRPGPDCYAGRSWTAGYHDAGSSR